jgi:hypothetical protein
MSKTVIGIVMAGLGLAGVFVAIMLSVFAFSARDDYGRVEIPGVEILHLPEGKIHVTYEERTGGREIRVPRDLAVEIIPVGGGRAIDYTPRQGSSTSNTTNTSRRSMNSFESPAEGDYAVSAIAPSAGPSPNLQFGKGFFYALFHGVPLYILIGCGLLIGGGVFVALRPVDERVAMPTAS